MHLACHRISIKDKLTERPSGNSRAKIMCVVETGEKLSFLLFDQGKLSLHYAFSPSDQSIPYSNVYFMNFSHTEE